MAGKESKQHASARLAFERSVAAGKPLTPMQLATRYKLALSTIYRAPFWKNRPAAGAQPQTGEK